MGRVKAQISVSLDGFMAGPNQSQDAPLGQGGMALHEWAFKLDAFNEAHGREVEGSGDNPSNAVIEEAQEDVGAVVMGRNMFGPVRGDWGDESWRGWWGENPPFHCPVFVLTHHPRESLAMEGGTVFHFVTDGVDSAFTQAREAAGGKDVSVGGGASTLQQAILSGHLEELLVNEAPIVLGSGERLFEGLPAGVADFELLDVVKGDDALHLKYRLG
jgi:dihydrofolate reductase